MFLFKLTKKIKISFSSASYDFSQKQSKKIRVRVSDVQREGYDILQMGTACTPSVPTNS